jgi:hypothetical protein
MPEFELRSTDRPARSQSLHRLRYPQFKSVYSCEHMRECVCVQEARINLVFIEYIKGKCKGKVVPVL